MSLSTIRNYYKLDESSGDAIDSVGSDLLINYGVVTYVSGKINNGALFNNTTGKHLVITNNLGFVSGGTRTWCCWVSISSFSSTGYILDNVTTSGNIRFILYSESDNKIHLFANGNEVLSQALSLNTFYFVRVTQNGNTWELFINEVSKGTTGVGGLSYAYNGFCIGESYAGGGAGKCTVDEVGIFSSVLNSSDGAVLYNSGAGRQYPFYAQTTASILCSIV